MDTLEKKISFLIKDQFPEFYQSDASAFIQFAKDYYEWLETYQDVSNIILPNQSVKVSASNTIVIGYKTSFKNSFSNGNTIAIYKSNTIYDIYTINAITNSTYLTLTSNCEFSNIESYVANTKVQYNPLYYSRRMMEYRDIDETISSFLTFYKQTYLYGLQFETNSNLRQILKHSLDIYRSKGTPRSIDLMFRLVFGTGAEIYFPSKDLFKLSDGKWKIPKYLELTLNSYNILLVNKEIRGASSGALAYVEHVVRRTVNGRLSDIAYINPISGTFIRGEAIDSTDGVLKNERAKTAIQGSLSNVSIDVLGTGSGFTIGDIVYLESNTGALGYGRVANTIDITGQISYELENGGYGYSINANVFVSNKILTINNVTTNTINSDKTFFYDFEQVKQPIANITYISANGITANLTGTLVINTTSNYLTGTSTSFVNNFSSNDYISVWSSAGAYVTYKILNVINSTSIQLYTNGTFSNITGSNYFKSNKFSNGDIIYNYYSNGTLAGEGKIVSHTYTNTRSGIIKVAQYYGNIGPIVTPNANLTGNVVITQNSYNMFGVMPNANLTGNVYVISRHKYLTGNSTLFDKELVYILANSSGTVEVNSTSSNIIGTGTSLSTIFTNNEYISIYSNSTHYETRQINVVTNATHLTLKSNFTIVNSTANFAKSKINGFIGLYNNATTFEIRQINTITNSTYLTVRDNFTFTNSFSTPINVKSSNTKFIIPGSNLTGTVSITTGNVTVTGSSTTFDTDYVANGFIAIYSNSTFYELYQINTITNSISLTLSNVALFTNTSATYSNVTSNTQIQYGKSIALYTNSTAYNIKLINNVANDIHLTIQTLPDYSNSSSIFSNTDSIYTIYTASNAAVANIYDYTDISATGNVIGSYSNLIIEISSISNAFSNSEEIYVLAANGMKLGNATYVSYLTSVGSNGTLRVTNYSGKFEPDLRIYGRTSNTFANIESISMSIGIINVSGEFLEDVSNILYGVNSLTNSTVTDISLGSGANVGIANDIIYTEYIDYYDEYISDYANVAIDATAYGFSNTLANSGTIIADAIGVTNTQVGKIYSLNSRTPGSDYNLPPIVKVYERQSYRLKENDYILCIDNMNGSFSPGEIITQSAIANSRALVKYTSSDLTLFDVIGTPPSNTTHLVFAERLHIKDEDSLIPTINSTTILVGEDTASTANVLLVSTDDLSIFLGYNANIVTDVITANGSVTELEVIDSGFGFENDQNVIFSLNDLSGDGTAVVKGSGKSRGFYKTNGGFLSSNKKLRDGWYYQEYSYDILSSLPLDKYEDMLKKVVHLLGTKYFATVNQSIVGNTNIKINQSSITVE